MDLTAIAMQNPWWRERIEILKDNKVKKSLELHPRRIYHYKEENIILLGPRQVGKTTYIKMVIMDLLLNKNINPRNILYLTCDFIDDKEDIKTALSFFDAQSDRNRMRFIFLDEISFVKDWNALILGLFNSGYLNDKRIYLTGSSSISLLKETFPGRNIAKVIFLPMQFKEYFDLFFKKIDVDTDIDIRKVGDFYKLSLKVSPYIEELNHALEQYLITGGFLWPSYEVRDSDPLDRLYEIYKDAIIGDISKLDKRQLYFKEIVEQMISGYTSRLSANSIAQNTSIGSNKTVEAYIEIMQDLFIARIFYKKMNGKVMYRSNKKIYFTDPFIYRVLKKYARGEAEYREGEQAKVIEGVVGTHLFNKFQEIYYMETKAGKEVDFLYNNIGIEIKYGNKKINNLYFPKGYLLTRDALPYLDGDRASIPLSIFLYLISSESHL